MFPKWFSLTVKHQLFAALTREVFLARVSLPVTHALVIPVTQYSNMTFLRIPVKKSSLSPFYFCLLLTASADHCCHLERLDLVIFLCKDILCST